MLLVILFIAYDSGGYVGGRMARFIGLKQGLAVWLWAIVTSAIIAAFAATAGSKYNVLSQLNPCFSDIRPQPRQQHGP